MISLILILAFYSGIFFLLAHSLKRQFRIFGRLQILELLLLIVVFSTVFHTLIIAINAPRWLTTGVMLLLALSEARRISLSKYKIPIIISGIALFPLLFYVLSNIPTYDTGLYHLTSVKWLTDVGFAPGIANVDGRLGTNQFFFLFAALFDIGPLYGKTWLILQLLLLIFVLFDLTRNIQQKKWDETVWPAIMLVLFYYNKEMIGSSSMDIWSFVYAIIAIRLFARGKLFDDSSTLAFVFASYAVCLKLSLLPIFAFAIIIFGIQLYQKKWNFDIKFSLIVSVILFAILGIHSFINTGYWIYPATFSAIPNVDWKVPQDQVKQMVLVISNFAKVRQTGLTLDYTQIMPMSEWIMPWLTWFLQNFWEATLLWIIGMGLAISRKNPIALSLAGLSIIGILYFVLMAPTPRFGLIWFFIPIGIYAQQILSKNRELPKAWVAIIVVIWTILVIHLPQKRGYGIRNSPLVSLPETLDVDVKKVGYNDDLSHHYFYTPKKGELIWNAPLPATTKWQKGDKFIFISTYPKWRGDRIKQGFRTEE